jgi:hypothetical protein
MGRLKRARKLRWVIKYYDAAEPGKIGVETGRWLDSVFTVNAKIEAVNLWKGKCGTGSGN